MDFPLLAPSRSTEHSLFRREAWQRWSTSRQIRACQDFQSLLQGLDFLFASLDPLFVRDAAVDACGLQLLVVGHCSIELCLCQFQLLLCCSQSSFCVVPLGFLVTFLVLFQCLVLLRLKHEPFESIDLGLLAGFSL